MRRYIFSLLLFFPCLCSLSAQSAAQEKYDPWTNPVILSHYDSTELRNIELTDPAKFTTIIYYYTRSFSVEAIDCTECLPFDRNMFDVSKFEHFRKKEEVYVRTFSKYGFKLTLIPVKDLEYKLPIHLE